MTLPALPVISRIGACPLDCPDGCSWIVDLEAGKPIRMRGNPDHPFTGKALCAKTVKYHEYVADPNRLLYPLRRIGKKGDGRFERISWETAIAEIAQQFQNTIDQFGGEGIWPYAGSGNVGWIQGIVGSGKRLFHHLNASQHNPNICAAAGHVGMSYTTGSAAGMDPEDLVSSKLILLWGTNTIETNQHLWPFITKARNENNAVVVCIDPIESATAKRSDLHIPIRPGTDGALVLGLIHRLVELDVHDNTFLSERTVGWDRFLKDVVSKNSLETAAAICGVERKLLEQFASLIATHSPMGIKTAMGIQQHGGGGQALRALSCLPAVTGDFQKPGGGICYSTGPAYGLNAEALRRPDLQKVPSRTLPMTRLGSILLDQDSTPVKSLFIWAGNPVVSNPDQKRVRAGLERDDLFTVVVDNFMTDTCEYADIVLPSTMQTEHLDLHDSYSHLYIQLNEPIVPPRGESLPHTEIFRRIAAEMKLTEPALFASDEQLLVDTLASDHPAMGGVTLETLREKGWARMNLPRPFLPFLESFPTTSGKFEFTSQKAAADGHGLMPHFVQPYESTKSGDDGSLALITSANKRLLNSVYGNRLKHQAESAVTVSVNPDDANSRGICDGERVRVWNARGEYSATLQISESIPRGIAQSPKGFWPKFNGGKSVNATVAERDADMGQGATFKDNRVFIESIEKGNENRK